MKKRMRAMRRWGEGAARWGLTLLLVALVGVTVASGWWRLEWTRTVPADAGNGSTAVAFHIRRGSLYRKTHIASLTRHRPSSSFWIARDPAWTPQAADEALTLDGPTPPPSFNLWRIRIGEYGWWKLSLSYPTLAVALPTLFLWYRSIFSRKDRSLCARCGYDLTGLAAVEERVVCPECGTGVAAARVIERESPRAAPAEGQAASPGARSAELD